jgi:CBS domain containing-hemolysin-like protein
MIGINTWRVGGDVSVHDWADAFGQRLVSTRVATLGGMIFDRLGRAPVAGDVVQLSNVQLKVEQVDRTRVVSVLVILDPQDAQEKVESGK